MFPGHEASAKLVVEHGGVWDVGVGGDIGIGGIGGVVLGVAAILA